MNNNASLFMAIIFFTILVATITGLLGLESSNDFVRTLMEFEVTDQRTRVFKTTVNFLGLMLAIFSFSLPIPGILNLIIVAPIAGVLGYLAINILKDMIPFT